MSARTNEDKRRAVKMLLDDAEWSQWSDREIARRAAVHHSFVCDMRKAHCRLPTVSAHDEGKTFTTKHGTISKMRTENIGRRKPSRVAHAASLPERYRATLASKCTQMLATRWHCRETHWATYWVLRKGWAEG